MNDLVDEQHTMHMAEQYSDRRIMVRLKNPLRIRQRSLALISAISLRYSS